MANPVDLQDAKTNLADLVDRAAAGEEIIIAIAGTPLARLMPLDQPRSTRQPGGWRRPPGGSGLRIADDFDAPLAPDILAGFSADGAPRPGRGTYTSFLELALPLTVGRHCFTHHPGVHFCEHLSRDRSYHLASLSWLVRTALARPHRRRRSCMAPLASTSTSTPT
jgi:prevent-host-death family protein